MAQDITALKQSFDEEYRAFLKTAERGSREVSQGELFQKYERLGISRKDMAQIIRAVDSETQDKTSKLESYVRRVGNCIKEFEKRSGENLEQESNNKTIDELIDLEEEQSEENAAADSDNREIELQLDSLRDKINEQDQNITDNVMMIGSLLIQAREYVEKIKHIKHIKWLQWLAENIKMPRSTASRYIKCTERFKNDVALAQHVDLSKITVSKMFELLSIPNDDFARFLEDVKEKDIKIQDMSKQELRDFIKGWKKNNIPQKPKSKFVVRLSIAEQDKLQVANILKSIFETNHNLSGDTLDSIANVIKSIENTDDDKASDTEPSVTEE